MAFTYLQAFPCELTVVGGAVGPGTLYPFGLTLTEVMLYYWKTKTMLSTGISTITITSTSPEIASNCECSGEETEASVSTRDANTMTDLVCNLGDGVFTHSPDLGGDCPCLTVEITVSFADVRFVDGLYYPMVLVSGSGSSTKGCVPAEGGGLGEMGFSPGFVVYEPPDWDMDFMHPDQEEETPFNMDLDLFSGDEQFTANSEPPEEEEPFSMSLESEPLLLEALSGSSGSSGSSSQNFSSSSSNTCPSLCITSNWEELGEAAGDEVGTFDFDGHPVILKLCDIPEGFTVAGDLVINWVIGASIEAA